MAMESKFSRSPVWSAVESEYTWPRGSLADDALYVKHGRVESLPPTPSKIVRIFLSSTFTDTYAERNLLIKSVYPKLKKVCKENYDLDFQVVDMRWGVRNEATVDHSAGVLCMTEIDNCMKYSVGPTFVALLSHRCGGRALPTRIPQHEMDEITAAINSSGGEDADQRVHSLALVQKWYKLDENAIPPEYNLQPIVMYKDMERFLQEPRKSYYYEAGDYLRDVTEEFDSIDALEKQIGDFMDEGQAVEEAKQVYRTLISTERNVWSMEEPILSRTIRRAVSQCVENGTLTHEDCHKYFQSITEEEVHRGLLEDPKRQDHCLVFRRRIDTINLDHKKAWRFIDMTDDNQLDTEAQDLLNHLKNVEVPACLPKENLFDFQVTWSDQEGINEQDHADYLEEFCVAFEKSVLALIERGVEKNSQSGAEDQVYPEVLEHGHQCVQRVEKFHGREGELDMVRDYILSTSDQPLVVYGESGCGKTSVLAKAATMIPKWLGDTRDVCVVLRFLGTTPDSSTVYKMLTSIMQQIISITDLGKQFPRIPEEFTDIRNMFKELLRSVPSCKRIIIVLDSLDQISGVADAGGLLWLPRKLSPNVKLVVSTIPKEHDILTSLRSAEMNLDPVQFLPVVMMTSKVSRKVIETWLERENRRLTAYQTELVEELIKGAVKPLYLKLIFDEIVTWKSYQKTTYYCPNISSCLHRLFRKLEVKHGETIVRHALGYLCASKNGLTGLEMEDILSLDEKVLTDVFEFHVPPIRRLPSILWARIRSDLQDYIVERGADGVRVMAWYHRQLIQDTNRRYLPGKMGYEEGGEYEIQNIHLFRGLAEYFAGIWGGQRKEKPFKYTEFQRKKLGLSSTDAALTRYVPEQPSIYRDQDGWLDIENMRFNRRKTSELPHACEAMLNTEDCTAFLAEHIVFNQEFLTAWIAAGDWEDVLSLILSASSGGNKFVPESGNLGERLSQLSKLRPDDQLIDLVLTSSDKDLLSRGTEGLAMQISAMMQSLVMSYTSTVHNPSYIGADITGRLLLHHNNNSLEGITNWIKSTDGNGRRLCALVPPHTQLDTPGSELFYVVTSHRGPVMDAVWSPGDDTLCISVSKRLIVSSIETGIIVQDTKPRSIPAGDHFSKLTALMTQYKKVLHIASLYRHPWIYVFNEQGEVLNVVDLAVYTKEPIQVSELKSFMRTNIDDKNASEHCVVVLDKTTNSLLCLHDILQQTVTCTRVGGDDSGRVCAAFLSNQDQSDDANSQLVQRKILLLKEAGCWELYNESWQLEDQRHFRWPVITSASADTNMSSNPIGIAIGFENGQVCLVTWNSQGFDLHNLNPVYLLHQSVVTSREEVAPHGPVSYVRYHTAEVTDDDEKSDTNISGKDSVRNNNDTMSSDNNRSGHEGIDGENLKAGTGGSSDHQTTGAEPAKYKYALGLAQTESCFFLYRVKPTAGDETGKLVADESDSGNKSKECLEIVWKADRKYDLAVFSRKLRFVFAVHGGMVDALMVKQLGHTKGEQLKVSTFMTIAAHSDDISKILVLEDDAFFMTFSKDSTVKFFLLGRARISRRYKPHFDHTEDRITEIAANRDTAITWAQLARSVYQWDILTGKIITTFNHPHHGNFIACATDAEMQLLAAMDTGTNCYIWKLRARPRDSTMASYPVVENPSPDMLLNTSIPADQLNASGKKLVPLLSILSQNLFVLALKGTNIAAIITLDVGQTKMEVIHPAMECPIECMLTLHRGGDDNTTGMALFVSEKECSVFRADTRSAEKVYSLQVLTGHDLSRVDDVKVMPYLGEVVFLVDTTIMVFWIPGSQDRPRVMSLDQQEKHPEKQEIHTDESLRKEKNNTRIEQWPAGFTLPGDHMGKNKIEWPTGATSADDHVGVKSSIPGQCCLLASEVGICVVLDKTTKHYTIVDTKSKLVLATRRRLGRGSSQLGLSSVEFCTLTPDGEYLVYVCGERRHLYLVRLTDGHLLAWYTLYTSVTALATSSDDGCYVLLGTADCRLFVLVIADPEVKGHDQRIQRVREANPPFPDHVIAQLMGNIGDYNNYSPDVSDSEEEEGVVRTGVIIDGGDDFGGSEGQEEDRGEIRESGDSGCEDLNVTETRRVEEVVEGRCFTATPCSLQ